jgi:hypothetical protein
MAWQAKIGITGIINVNKIKSAGCDGQNWMGEDIGWKGDIAELFLLVEVKAHMKLHGKQRLGL